MEIIAKPLTRDAFAPYGEVIQCLSEPGREFFNDCLVNTRTGAKIDLSLALVEPNREQALKVRALERHEFSSQTFLPIHVARYVVVVAPVASGGGPDTRLAQAFIATGRQGITYRANTWHHMVTVLDEPGEFAVLMWCDGSKDDQEFCQLKDPFTVQL